MLINWQFLADSENFNYFTNSLPRTCWVASMANMCFLIHVLLELLTILLVFCERLILTQLGNDLVMQMGVNQLSCGSCVPGLCHDGKCHHASI